MKIASEVAGFSLAKADIMRRAMGKKDKRADGETKDRIHRWRRQAAGSPRKPPVTFST